MTEQQKEINYLKRSNKVAREARAKRKGFNSYEEYLANLQGIVVELTDMVIAFDTTGSMMTYLASVQKHVKELIPKLLGSNPNLKISIVAFGDYCDMKGENNFDKAYQKLDLTDNVDKLVKFVSSALTTGGGDDDEFYELVIRKIVNETSWRQNSSKAVLFIADANPHKVGYINTFGVRNDIDWKVEAEAAATKGIVFDTLFTRPNVEWYQELSKITGGVCLPFSNSEKTGQLVLAATTFRGGINTVTEFTKQAKDNTDKELEKVYSMYKKVVNKK